MNYYYNPVRTIQGNGCMAEIPGLLHEVLPAGGTVLLLVWNETVLEEASIKSWMESGEFHVEARCFTASNPTMEQLFSLYEETKSLCPGAVVAIGGGSVMDVGKSLCCIYGKELESVDDLRYVITHKEYDKPSAKWIGVPTTAGTGSEVTCWATIWDPGKNAKRSVESMDNYAYAAVVDPELTAGMPVGLAVSSALDAVAHSVESYWANGSNAVSKVIALGAIRIIMDHIDDLLAGDGHAHEYISQGSMMSGMAFSNTRTTACHSISYPLTMQYQIPHGTAVSMLLAPVLKINQEKTPDMGLLLQALGVENGDMLEERIQGILKKAGIPASLKEWKVEYGTLPALAAMGITKGRADNNPVDLTPEMIETILEGIY